MIARPEHAPLIQFPIVDDELVVGGQRIRELAEQVGRTPFYAYDREALTRRMQCLRETLPDALSIHYAIKANPMPAVVDHMAALTDGLDVASAGEMRIALNSGMAPEAISFAGPGKRTEELRAAVSAGVTINLESHREFERVRSLGTELGLCPSVAVRVNPDFELKSSGMKMGGGAQPFGIDAEQVPSLLDQIGNSELQFRGFQIYAGSQNLRAERLIEAQAATFALAYRLAGSAPVPIETLNIGGGFGVPYFPGERRLHLAPIAQALGDMLTECRDRLGGVRVILELGRYIVAEAGVYVCRVVDRKTSRGEVFLVTDGGLHHHLAASGNFGQIVRRNYPVVIGHRVLRQPREVASVVGPLCTPLDILADRLELGVAEVGDLIVVLQSGAYGYSASPHAFLGHPPPREVLV